MGREVKRVPLDFDWPEGVVWSGYFMPDELQGDTCPDCVDPTTRYAHGATPEARAIAQTFYPHQIVPAGASPGAREHGEKLAWYDKLTQDEVDHLAEAGRLRYFGPHYDRIDLDPPYELSEFGTEIRFEWVRNATPPPDAAAVNRWARQGLGHDAINRNMLIRFRCARLNITMQCATCDGHGTVEHYDGQRADADAWQPTEPPEGDGYQLWETVTEGSPASPVFASADDLAQWLTTREGGRQAGPGGRPMSLEQAQGFVGAGWAPTGVLNAGGMHDGAEYVGTNAALGLDQQEGNS